MKKKYNISKDRLAETTIPVRAKLSFAKLCRTQSKCYPPYDRGPKLSTSRFLKEAAKEKLIFLGVDKELIESMT